MTDLSIMLKLVGANSAQEYAQRCLLREAKRIYRKLYLVPEATTPPPGWERELWILAVSGTSTKIPERIRNYLLLAAHAAGGWFVCADGKEPTFLPIEQWLASRMDGGTEELTKRMNTAYRRQLESRLAVAPSTSGLRLLDRGGDLLLTNMLRIVIGDRGAYVEFERDHLALPLELVEERPTHNHWQTAMGVVTKIYEQKGTVPYADYRIGKWYVAADRVLLEDLTPLLRRLG